MKKTIKILAAALTAVSFGSLVHAQSATISANATVMSQITVVNNANLNFGTIIIGQTKTILGDGNVSVDTGSAIGSANRGVFTVGAQKGSNVRLTFVLPSNLSKEGGDLLPISFNLDEGNFAAVYETSDYTSVEFNPNDGILISGFNASEPSPDAPQSVTVRIGGKVDASTATSGTYTGSITLSATYN